MTATQLPTYDPRRLAEALREQGLPGQRSMTAIKNLRRDRRNRHQAEWAAAHPDTPESRLSAQLTARYSTEVRRRGGETSIRNGRNHYLHLAVVARKSGLVLLHVSGWRYYSGSTKPSWAALSYLCGHEDSQDWAVRVPGTITSVDGALAWIKPADVTRAERAGRRVERQGDLYAVETTRRHDGTGDLPDRHAWDPATRSLSHPQHAPLHLPYPVRFVMQNSYGMGRGARRGCGDE